jgi:hypothetical protein
VTYELSNSEREKVEVIIRGPLDGGVWMNDSRFECGGVLDPCKNKETSTRTGPGKKNNKNDVKKAP